MKNFHNQGTKILGVKTVQMINTIGFPDSIRQFQTSNTKKVKNYQNQGTKKLGILTVQMINTIGFPDSSRNF